MANVGATLKPVIAAAAVSSAIQLLLTLALFAWVMGDRTNLSLLAAYPWLADMRILATHPSLALPVVGMAVLSATVTAGVYVLALKVRR